MTFDMTWEKIFSERPWGKYPSEDVIRFIARNFYKAPDRKKIKVLDLGCGGGAQTWFMAREGFDVYAIDGSASAIEQTRKLLADHALTANLQVGDIAKLNYADNYFDAVIDSNTVQHNCWNDILSIHSEIKRVLKPTGLFLGLMLGSETTGWEFAKRIDENTFQGFQNPYITTDVVAHLFTQNEVDLLMQDYKDVEISRMTRYKEKDGISHFVVSARMNNGRMA